MEVRRVASKRIQGITVEIGGDTATPGDFPPPPNTPVTPARTEPVAPSDQEKKAVGDLLRSLGL
jgi:hypothetical protein